MKTTKKKGFTLIELIVVIAIIGVLAAILVPAMLGYVKKSKIQSANSAANTMLKAANSALTEMDEDDSIDISSYSGDYGNKCADTEFSGREIPTELASYMQSYSDNVKSASYAISIKDGIAIAAAAKSGKYYGTSPAAFTNKTYDEKMGDGKMKKALELAVAKYNADHDSSSST